MGNLKARYAHPDCGYQHDKDSIAKSGLIIGDAYNVSGVDMGSYHTTIHLEEFGGHFNSVNFEFEVDGKPYDIFSDPTYNPYLEKGALRGS